MKNEKNETGTSLTTGGNTQLRRTRSQPWHIHM